MDDTQRSYRGWERRVARLLERMPRLRAWTSAAYRRVRYLPHAFGQTSNCTLHPAVRLRSANDGGARAMARPCFFGYYDKTPWSPDMRRFLFHRARQDVVEICVLDPGNGRVEVLGESRTWNWQQGCQLQWQPGSEGRAVLYNTLHEGLLGCRVVQLDGSDDRFVPWPIQSVHAEGRTALSLNYRRLHARKPEYGYAVDAANFAPDQPLERDGLWLFDFETGASRLQVSLAWLARHEARRDMARAAHKVNHGLFSPAGTRYVFMHRWTGERGRCSRLYVASLDGGSPRLLMDTRMVSHYGWRDEQHLIVWGRTAAQGDHYYLLDVTTGSTEVMGAGQLDRLGDGHPGYGPDRRWIVTDSYPDMARCRHLLLYDVATARCTELGAFFAPWRFDGPARCDLHPRWSPDGRSIAIDSTHTGWRDTYVLDIAALLDA